MRIVCTVAVMLVLVGLCGCVKTRVTGFTDRDFVGYRIQKVLVYAANVDFEHERMIEKAVVGQLAKKKIPADSYIESFPPTREWSFTAVTDELTKDGFDSVMFVNFGNSKFYYTSLGTTTTGNISNNGTATTYGNNTRYNGTTTYRTTTTESVRPDRVTAIRVDLYDIATCKPIWVGDCKTEAGGTLYMRDSTQINNFSKKLISTLKDSGHI